MEAGKDSGTLTAPITHAPAPSRPDDTVWMGIQQSLTVLRKEKNKLRALQRDAGRNEGARALSVGLTHLETALLYFKEVGEEDYPL
jgi:hypothetical protein